MNRGVFTELPASAFLRECFDYDSDAGVLRWRIRPLAHFKNAHGMNTFNSKFAGTAAGTVKPTGYVTVSIQGRSYLAHRLIWKLVGGREPVGEIDHRNRDKACNQWTNLREASHQQNTFNRPAQSVSVTGIKGVSFDRRRNKFAAHIRTEGRSRFLGRFSTAEEAKEAYIAAARPHHGEFATE